MSDNLPGAWYDASAHLDQAMSVLESVPDLVALKGTLGGYQYANNLIEATNSLLKLLEEDLKRLEKQCAEDATITPPQSASVEA